MQQDQARYCQVLPVKKSRLVRLNSSLLPPLIVAALPKCPVCLMGLMSVVGLGSLAQASWLLPLTVIFLVITVAALTISARQRRGYGPFFLGVISAALFLLGKFQVDYMPLTLVGLALLICSSLWNSWPKKAAVNEDDCDC